MIVSTEGRTFDESRISGCSYGDTVKYQRVDGSRLYVNEMAVIGMVATVIPNPGKF